MAGAYYARFEADNNSSRPSYGLGLVLSLLES
jgi:hypothetical protein